MRRIPFTVIDELGVEERVMGSLPSPYDGYSYGRKDNSVPPDPILTGTCGGVVPAQSYGGRPRFTIRGKEVTQEQARQILLGRIFRSEE